MAHAISIHILLIYGSIQGKAVRAGFSHRNKQVSLGSASQAFLDIPPMSFFSLSCSENHTNHKLSGNPSSIKANLQLTWYDSVSETHLFSSNHPWGPFIGSDRITYVKFSNFTTPQGEGRLSWQGAKGNQHR